MKIFSKKIKSPLILNLYSFISLVFLLVTGLIGYNSLNKSVESVVKLTQVEYPKVLLIQKFRSENHALMRFLWTAHGLYQYQGERESQLKEAQASFNNLKLSIEEINKIQFNEDLSKIITEINKRWKDLSATVPVVIGEFSKGTDAAKEAGTTTLAFESVALANEIHEFLKELDIKVQETIHADIKNEEEKNANLKKLLSISIVIGFVTLVLFGLIFANQLSRLLLDIAKNIKENADSLFSAARRVSDSTKLITDDTTKQATAMAETSSSVVELNSMIAQNSDNAKHSADISNTNKKVVEESKLILNRVMSAIKEVDNGNDQLAHQVTQNNEKLKEVVDIIMEINNKTAVINDIVFQIKLLSFNASVEAARAGEHGKGFSVVAEEVGNLAQNTAKAALEITELLNSSVDNVKKIAKETAEQIDHLVHSNKDKVSKCISYSKECDDQLQQVKMKGEEVNTMIHDISASSREQASGMDEISKAMNQLSDIFHNSQKLTTDNLESVEVLYRQVENLNEEVSNLNVMVTGERKISVLND